MLSLGEICRPTGLSIRPVCHHLLPLRTSSTVLHLMALANP
ncbi:hypothetical protein [Luteococcus sanguinis]|uniref:Uncharacterized protein n=1 Tax=Luteococcus sanguinis TaxID=174038 RepID=A0ABW1X6F6_9ACTN